MQVYVKHFVMTGSQVRGVKVTTLCDKVCDEWRQVKGVLDIALYDKVCDDWRQVKGVLDITLYDKVCDDYYCTVILFLMLFICHV